MNSQPSIVIAAYKPKPGKEHELLQLVHQHIPVLRSEGLVTDREPVVMRAKDGTIIEIFEWRSAKSIEEAHSNSAVQHLWKKFGEVCDYVKPADIKECKQVFSGFEPVQFM